MPGFGIASPPVLSPWRPRSHCFWSRNPLYKEGRQWADTLGTLIPSPRSSHLFWMVTWVLEDAVSWPALSQYLMSVRYCSLRQLSVQNEWSICDVISLIARLSRSRRRESGDGATSILPNDSLSPGLDSIYQVRVSESKKGMLHHWAS